MKALRERFTSLAIPALALIVLVSIGVVESRLPTTLYWSMLASALFVLVLWKVSIRTKYGAFAQAVLIEDQGLVLHPYAIAYTAVYLGTVVAVVCTYCFDLSSTFLIAAIAPWFLRMDFWTAMILRGLDRAG